ncbi:MAG: lipocalin family protein [Bacteroidales bacterium]|jgi:hypothetical protein|nr:lipocalin family protein [Bacteroidales bacterium]
MRKISSTILLVASIALIAVSCKKDDPEVSFDESLIIGKWKSGTLFERYDIGKTGATWDTADDVDESEAQTFTWTLEKDQLEQIHIIQNGGKVPKTYTVTALTATTLSYKDNFGKTKTFSKQN